MHFWALRFTHRVDDRGGKGFGMLEVVCGHLTLPGLWLLLQLLLSSLRFVIAVVVLPRRNHAVGVFSLAPSQNRFLLTQGDAWESRKSVDLSLCLGLEVILLGARAPFKCCLAQWCWDSSAEMHLKPWQWWKFPSIVGKKKRQDFYHFFSPRPSAKEDLVWSVTAASLQGQTEFTQDIMLLYYRMAFLSSVSLCPRGIFCKTGLTSTEPDRNCSCCAWCHQTRLCQEYYWVYLGLACFGLHEGARPLLGWAGVPW